MDRFSQILYDLSKELDTDLYPDQNRLCQINWEDKLSIQLQFDEAKDRLLVGVFICDVPPGKYREKLFKEALKSNAQFPRIGTLAYTDRNNKLTMFEYVYGENLHADKLAKFLEQFIAKATLWKEAVEQNKPLPRIIEKTTPSDSIFGPKK